MILRNLTLPAIALAAALLTANVAWGLGEELSESKEELKLVYDVSATDHGTGRVTIHLTIADEGRLAPLDRGVSFVIPSRDGTGYVDLSAPLERKVDGGKQHLRIHLLKEWAERGAIHLQTNTLDGKQTPLTWYYHVIPVKPIVAP